MIPARMSFPWTKKCRRVPQFRTFMRRNLIACQVIMPVFAQQGCVCKGAFNQDGTFLPFKGEVLRLIQTHGSTRTLLRNHIHMPVLFKDLRITHVPRLFKHNALLNPTTVFFLETSNLALPIRPDSLIEQPIGIFVMKQKWVCYKCSVPIVFTRIFPHKSPIINLRIRAPTLFVGMGIPTISAV